MLVVIVGTARSRACCPSHHPPMLGPLKPRRLDDPITVSLEDLVPRDHVGRPLKPRRDHYFVRTWTNGSATA